VVVTPLGHGTNQVVVKTKDVLAKHLGACSEEPRVISDQSLPTLVRQLALHANVSTFVTKHMKLTLNISMLLQLASMIVKQTQARYASNWLERLRHIKRLRARVCTGDPASAGESGANGGRGATIGLQRRVQMDDFTEYTHYK
jgi:tuberous sclerosis protein 2